MSQVGRVRVLRASVDSPTYVARYFDTRGPVDHYYPLPAVPHLKLSAVHDDKAGALTLFALNRHLKDEMPLPIPAKEFSGFAVEQAFQMPDSDLHAGKYKAKHGPRRHSQ